MVYVSDDDAGALLVRPRETGRYVIARHMKGAGPAWLAPRHASPFGNPNDVVWVALYAARVFDTYAEVDAEQERVWTRTNRATIEPYIEPAEPAHEP